MARLNTHVDTYVYKSILDDLIYICTYIHVYMDIFTYTHILLTTDSYRCLVYNVSNQNMNIYIYVCICICIQCVIFGIIDHILPYWY